MLLVEQSGSVGHAVYQRLAFGKFFEIVGAAGRQSKHSSGVASGAETLHTLAPVNQSECGLPFAGNDFLGRVNLPAQKSHKILHIRAVAEETIHLFLVEHISLIAYTLHEAHQTAEESRRTVKKIHGHSLTQAVEEIFGYPVDVVVSAARCGVGAKGVKELTHGPLHGLAALEGYLVITCQVGLARESTEYHLKERVDGAHLKEIKVEEQTPQGLPGGAGYMRARGAEFLFEIAHIRASLFPAPHH